MKTYFIGSRPRIVSVASISDMGCPQPSGGITPFFRMKQP